MRTHSTRKRVLVTGGNAGIGLALVKQLNGLAKLALPTLGLEQMIWQRLWANWAPASRLG
jgi:hypothetical protein